MKLDPRAVEAAAAAQSGSPGFWFTRRGLMLELARAGAWPEPGGDLAGDDLAFARALAAHESGSGRLRRLVRPEEAPASLTSNRGEGEFASDLFDYSVRRVIVLQSLDLCLMLIANGLHRQIEIAPLALPAFPAHVWARIDAQLAAGLETTIFALHDCGLEGDTWWGEVGARFAAHPSATVTRVGLTLPMAFRLGLPVRSGPPATRPAADQGDNEFAAVLSSGDFALLEELNPLRLLSFVYRRVARGAEDFGFG